MKAIKTFYFPIFLVGALCTYTAQRFGWYVPELVNNYLNDFLCMPIVLKMCQYSVRFVRSDKTIVVPLTLKITLTLLFSFYFEYLLPIFAPRYTSDGLDVVAYFTGLLVFITLEGQWKVTRTTMV
ncbi:hypothetical protein [Maribacter sp. 2-571]|uniref:hypothetical protein n=1 Tax=Maribacter sp. 2-571 TaxID=3417569 RepID=UPI003D339323